ncbi:MAG: hypothetical protein JO340_06300 [Acidobacteriaceae bacterium]|nr:hypothetical protein [Acidobacteriaceae bacterium]
MIHPREEQLALYSTGDLDPDALERIAAHLDECLRCRECADQFYQLQQVLATPAAEPDAKDLQNVRRRVMENLPRGVERRWRFEWAIALAALIALVIFLNRSLHSPAPLPVVPAQPVAAALLAQLPSSPIAIKELAMPRRASPRAPGLGSIALVARPDREPLIKIATTDPKIVILLTPSSPNEERTESNE